MTDNKPLLNLTSLNIYLNDSQLEKLSILADSDNPLEVEAYANTIFTDELLRLWLRYKLDNLTIED